MIGPFDTDLSDKVAIVTGATGGIGSEICRQLAARGAALVLVSRSIERLSSVSKSLSHANYICVQADLRDAEAPQRIVSSAVDRYRRIDFLVNSAGEVGRRPFHAFERPDWVDGFAGKMIGAAMLCQHAWPHLQDVRGAIVNVVGTASKKVEAGGAIVSAVNSALLSLTQSLAVEGRDVGIRVNAVNPGPTQTPRLNARIQKLALEQGLSFEAASDLLLNRARLTRFARPEEVAAAVLFFLSPASEFCTGAALDIDGGSHL